MPVPDFISWPPRILRHEFLETVEARECGRAQLAAETIRLFLRRLLDAVESESAPEIDLRIETGPRAAAAEVATIGTGVVLAVIAVILLDDRRERFIHFGNWSAFVHRNPERDGGMIPELFHLFDHVGVIVQAGALWSLRR